MIHTPKFPLRFDNSTIFANAKDIKDVVMFHLKNLILTVPGEKISDPAYGVGLRQYLFENLSVGLLNNISQQIVFAINRYINYIILKDVTVTSPDDSHEIDVSIIFQIPGDIEDQNITLNTTPDTNTIY